MVSGNKLMTVFTPVATPAVPREAGNPARPLRQCLSWRQILPLSHLTCQLPNELAQGDNRLYTMDVRFEWDPAKAAANLRTHRVSFAEAVTG